MKILFLILSESDFIINNLIKDNKSCNDVTITYYIEGEKDPKTQETNENVQKEATISIYKSSISDNEFYYSNIGKIELNKKNIEKVKEEKILK